MVSPSLDGTATSVIALRGEFNFANRVELADMLRVAESLERVTIDLRGVTLLDASALACIVHLHNRMGPLGKTRVRLVDVLPRLAHLLRLVRLDALFEICELDAPGTTATSTLLSGPSLLEETSM